MRLLQNGSGNHLCMRPEEALKLIEELAKVVALATRMRGSAQCASFVEPVVLSLAHKDKATVDSPSTIHFFIEQSYK